MLDEAYHYGWLTDNDVRSIAYYYYNFYKYNEYISKDYLPTPKTPEELDEDTVKQIKEDYINDGFLKNIPDVSADRINLFMYYGTYCDCVVVGINDNYGMYKLKVYPEYKAGNVIIYRYLQSSIRVWNKTI